MSEQSEENDFGIQILFQWFTGECINQPVDTIIINKKHFNELGHEKIQELTQFMVKHGAVEYLQIVGTENVPENQVYTSAVGE